MKGPLDIKDWPNTVCGGFLLGFGGWLGVAVARWLLHALPW